MKKIFTTILLTLTICSCDIAKQATKTKSDTDFKEHIETTTRRIGDTVTYKNILHVKDTTIYTVNRQGTTLKTVYDQSGTITSIDCFASAIDEIKKENREFQQSIKDKASEKTENLNTTWILYGFGAIVLLGGLAMFLLFKTVNKNANAIISLAESLKSK